jgi:hypothetical protein
MYDPGPIYFAALLLSWATTKVIGTIPRLLRTTNIQMHGVYANMHGVFTAPFHFQAGVEQDEHAQPLTTTLDNGKDNDTDIDADAVADDHVRIPQSALIDDSNGVDDDCPLVPSRIGDAHTYTFKCSSRLSGGTPSSIKHAWGPPTSIGHVVGIVAILSAHASLYLDQHMSGHQHASTLTQVKTSI